MSLTDVLSVHAIERESFPAPWRARTFLARMLLLDHFGYVAEAEGRVVGYIVFQIKMRTVHLQKIAVTKAHRRRGIATQLMHMMLDLARTQRCETVFLQVRVSNAAAQEFYRRFDFVLDHIHESYYHDSGEAAQVLVRDVAARDPDN